MTHPDLYGVRTLIFDMDGTLIRSGELAKTVLRGALERFYLARNSEPPRYSDEELLAGIGKPSAEFYISLLTEKMKPHWEAFRSEILAGEDEQMARRRITFPGAIKTLRLLKQRGYRLALVSNCSMPYLNSVLDQQGLREHFEIATCIDAYDGANKASLIRDVAEQLGERAVMIGDRAYDIEGAVANGIPSVGVTYGYGSQQELMEASTWVDDIRQLSFLFDPLRELGERIADEIVERVDGSRPWTVALSCPHPALSAPLVAAIADSLADQKLAMRHVPLEIFSDDAEQDEPLAWLDANYPFDRARDELAGAAREGRVETNWAVRRGPQAGQDIPLRARGGGVLLIEGPGLLREGWADGFDYRIHLAVSTGPVLNALRRAGSSLADPAAELQRWRTRLWPAWRAHLRMHSPAVHADTVVDGNRLASGLRIDAEGRFVTVTGDRVEQAANSIP